MPMSVPRGCGRGFRARATPNLQRPTPKTALYVDAGLQTRLPGADVRLRPVPRDVKRTTEAPWHGGTPASCVPVAPWFGTSVEGGLVQLPTSNAQPPRQPLYVEAGLPSGH